MLGALLSDFVSEKEKCRKADMEEGLNGESLSGSCSDCACTENKLQRRDLKRSSCSPDDECPRKDTYYYRQKMKVPSFPRIMKHDIRREYASLLLKAINSTDMESILRFTEQHCVPQCVLTDYTRENICKGAVSNVRGAEHVGRLLFRSVEAFPDMVCRAQGSRIVRRSNEERSDVVIHAIFQGNRVGSSSVIKQKTAAADNEAPLKRKNDVDILITATLHLNEQFLIEAITLTAVNNNL